MDFMDAMDFMDGEGAGWESWMMARVCAADVSAYRL